MPLRFKIILGLNLLYCSVAAFTKKLPAWRMFERVEKSEGLFRDRGGKIVDVRNFLPHDAYVLDVKSLVPILEFICDQDRGRAPYTFVKNDQSLRLVLEPYDCKARQL